MGLLKKLSHSISYFHTLLLALILYLTFFPYHFILSNLPSILLLTQAEFCRPHCQKGCNHTYSIYKQNLWSRFLTISAFIAHFQLLLYIRYICKYFFKVHQEQIFLLIPGNLLEEARGT